MNDSQRLLDARASAYGLGVLAWAAGWAAMIWLDGRLDLANLALLLVLAAAVATWWLPVPMSLAAGAASVLAFNWLFVPPRGTFTVDLQQHALLLGAMLLLSWIVAALMALLRRRSRQLARVARHRTPRWPAGVVPAAARPGRRARRSGHPRRRAGQPRVPRPRTGAVRPARPGAAPFATSYFLSRETVVVGPTGTMARWRERLFAAMSRNASGVAGYFRLPDNTVVELGTRVQI